MPNPAQRQRSHGMVTVTRYRRRPQPAAPPYDPNAAPEHAIPRYIRVAPATSPFNDDVIREAAWELRRRRWDADNHVTVPAHVGQHLAGAMEAWRTS